MAAALGFLGSLVSKAGNLVQSDVNTFLKTNPPAPIADVVKAAFALATPLGNYETANIVSGRPWNYSSSSTPSANSARTKRHSYGRYNAHRRAFRESWKTYGRNWRS